MGPQVALLVAALAGCLLPAGGCVICDQRVVAALDALEKEYLPTHMARERQRQVMETIRQTVRNFWDLPYLEDAFMGVIDEATMETSVLGFLRSMTLITNSDIAGKWQSGQGRGFGILWLWSQTAQVQTPALSSPGCVAFREGYHSFVTSKLGHNGACTQASDLAQWPAWLSGHSISLPLPEMAPTWNASLFRRVPVPPPGVGGRRGRTLSPCSFPDDTFVKEFSWMLTLEKAAFQRNVARFQREGMMLQPLIWCSNCKKQLHVCRKSTDCGVLPQRIIEETPTSNFETGEQLSPTLQPSEYPKPEKVLRSVLGGLLIWGFVVLIISFVTAVLCFLPGNVMDSIKSWFLTNKVAALQSQVPKAPKENDTASSHK
ncbi:izumo sperm-egg fusion protein 1 isoform X10 [Herpailurus yagouaroundi]|uniref:izumo sperm-egg fusion protein 1 isoform X10 n=1 Tax=Herpailurus yagouaroundi TaxID=1608482 RepID=UPI001AD6DBE6|nr:izumo sperm-egg fusion protein 1 isoform X10 [Puma yagouaroundi]